jgi:hypothetical protein
MDPMKNPEVERVLRMKFARDQPMVKGQYFKESLFPREILEALAKLPNLSRFDVEHALFTVGPMISSEGGGAVQPVLEFLYNQHMYLTGDIRDEEYADLTIESY